MLQGMKRVPQSVAEPWHGDEEPKYLKPYVAATKYVNAKKRTSMFVGIAFGSLTGGALVAIPSQAAELMAWVAIVVFAFVALGTQALLRMRAGLVAKELALEAERGIKIVEPLEENPPKKEKAA